MYVIALLFEHLINSNNLAGRHGLLVLMKSLLLGITFYFVLLTGTSKVMSTSFPTDPPLFPTPKSSR